MGRKGGEEFISRNHGGLAGWFLPSKANPRCGRQRRRRPPWTFGPCIYIYIFYPRIFSPRLQFLVPSTLARMPRQDFAVSFQQLDKSCRLLRVIPKKILPRNRRKIYIRNERTLLPVLSSPTEKNNGVFSRDGKGILLYS